MKDILLKCLILILILTQNLISELLQGTKGTLKLNVEVQDELGIDTISEFIELKNIAASEIEPFIRARLSRWGTVQINDSINTIIITDKEPKVKDLKKLVEKLDNVGSKDFLRLNTLTIPLNFTNASSIKEMVQNQLSPDGQMIIDNSHNSLVITDVKSKIETISKIIYALDVFVPQVVIEVIALEISGDYLRKVGINWSVFTHLGGGAQIYWDGMKSKEIYKYKTQTIRETNIGDIYTKQESPIQTEILEYQKQSIPVPSWQVSSYIDFNKLFNFINYLVSENNAKVLTQSKVVTSNNKSASIIAGEKIFFSTPNNSYEYQIANNGLNLSVTPTIGKDQVVTLDLKISISDLIGWSRDGNPILSERSLSSSVLLKDGETFVLGGIEKATMVKNEVGIPVLRTVLPFIFSKKVDTQIKNQVIVFITPHIKRDFGYAPDLDLKKLDK